MPSESTKASKRLALALSVDDALRAAMQVKPPTKKRKTKRKTKK